MAQTPKSPAAPRNAEPAKAAGTSRTKAAASAPKTVAATADALATSKKPAEKPRPRTGAPVKPAPDVHQAASALVNAVGETFVLRKKDLVDRVVTASGAKKKQVKDIVAHTLKVLGDAISKGEQLNLLPFRPAKTGKTEAAPATAAKPAKAAKPLAVPEKGR